MSLVQCPSHQIRIVIPVVAQPCQLSGFGRVSLGNAFKRGNLRREQRQVLDRRHSLTITREGFTALDDALICFGFGHGQYRGVSRGDGQW